MKILVIVLIVLHIGLSTAHLGKKYTRESLGLNLFLTIAISATFFLTKGEIASFFGWLYAGLAAITAVYFFLKK